MPAPVVSATGLVLMPTATFEDCPRLDVLCVPGGVGVDPLLQGRRATTHWNAHDLLAAYSTMPTQGRVVRDGMLVTGGGVTAGIDFALTLVAGRAAAEAIQLNLEYAPEPPLDAGTPERAPEAVLASARDRTAGLRARRAALAAAHVARPA